jgi:hypothetical protein
MWRERVVLFSELALLELGTLCVACNHDDRKGRLWTQNFGDESEFRWLPQDAEGLEL